MKISKRQKRYFELAGRISHQSDYGCFHHGAILVKGGSIINVSSNKSSFCSFSARFRSPNKGNATLHAEIGTILGVDRSNTQGADVYVVRVNNGGKFRMSKPCSMCESAMKYCGISRVYYSTSDENQFEMMKL